MLSLFLTIGCGAHLEPFREGSDEVGYASWYGEKFHGRKTASGEPYNMYDRTAAHRRAPFGTRVRVTNLSNGRSTVVRVNDRGPFVRGRIVDLSLTAARDTGLIQAGTAKVLLSFLEPEEKLGRFFIQVGSFRETKNALRMQTEVSTRFPGLHAHIRRTNDLQRVWLGPFEREEEATDLVGRLRKAGYEALILRR